MDLPTKLHLIDSDQIDIPQSYVTMAENMRLQGFSSIQNPFYWAIIQCKARW